VRSLAPTARVALARTARSPVRYRAPGFEQRRGARRRRGHHWRRPHRAVSLGRPGISAGTGWRGLWLSPESGKNPSLQRLELARLQLGVDYRINRDLAVSPVVGGSLNMFVSQDSPIIQDYTEIQTRR
jgi:hypothetical protein